MTVHDLTPQQYLQAGLRRVANAASEGAAYTTWDDGFARKEVTEAWSDANGTFSRSWGRRVTAEELRAIPEADLYALGFGNWDEEGNSLYLIPLWAFNYIADGTPMRSIMGNDVIKGDNDIDLDVRFGCLAYGIPKEAA